MENIWYKDPIKVFFNMDNVPKFIPTKSMTFIQQLNATMRFSIYFTIIMLLVKQNGIAMYFAVFVALITIFMFEFYTHNKKLQRELYSKINVMYNKHEDKLCSLPSQNNPFMNVMMNEYSEFPNRPVACNVSNTKVKKQAEQYFANSIFRDVDDIYSRKTSSRNWHTVPSAQIPNDREAFTDWLYKSAGKTCKEDGNKCYQNIYHPYNV